jgi:uncharacterized protein (DUF1800 family)
MSIRAASSRRKYKATTEVDIARLLLQGSYGATYTELTTALNGGHVKACEQWVDSQLTRGNFDWAGYKTLALAAGVPGYDVSSSDYATWHRHFSEGTAGRLRARWFACINRFFSVNYQTLSGADYDVLDGFRKQIEPYLFGNFRDLLRAVSMSHQMSYWLTYMGKGKETSTNQPDENYARELMQLYTIGLWELNVDGTHRLNGQLDPADSRYVAGGTAEVATYTNADIRGLAKVFTGYGNYASTTTMQVYTDNTAWNSQIVNVPAYHESGAKTFLQTTIPASTNASTSLDSVINRLVTHDSCGPFMAKNFIQMLTTSNPSPGYISRVASVFRDNGSGVAGDLKAFLKAILMDQEARATAKAQSSTTWGRIQDYWWKVVQAFTPFAGTRSDGKSDILLNRSYTNPGQIGMFGKESEPPSVFRHYSSSFAPNSTFAAANNVAPELQIMSEASFPNMSNNYIRSHGSTMNVGETAGTDTPSILYSSLTGLGSDAAMLDQITLLTIGYALPAGAIRTDILNYMTATGGTATDRVRAAWRKLGGYPEFYIIK